MSVVLRNRYRNIGPDYEQKTLEVWTKLMRASEVAWDVGSNIGVYSIISGKILGKGGEVQAWEPTPVSFDASRTHLRLNKVSSWCFVNRAAVGDSDGSIVRFGLMSTDDPTPTNRLGALGARAIEVPMVTLDGELSRGRRVPDIVKIDIEGAEMLALRGARALMTRRDARPTIVLAVHPMFLSEFNSSLHQLTEIIRELEYESFTTEGAVSTSLEYGEYVLIPTERVASTSRHLGWVT